MERGMTVDQVLRALWRRRWLVLAIAGGVFAVGAAIVATLPSKYTSTAVVRVEPQHPVAEMVYPTISEAIPQRIVTIRQELLARPVLQQVIEELELYQETVGEKGIDAAVEHMRKDLAVKIEGENAFELTYTAEDPVLAANVANALPRVFAQEAVKSRQAAAERAAKLFSDEMDALKTSVVDWEKRMAQFKVDHMGELPEQMESNMRALDRIGFQLEERYDELRMTQMRRADMLRAHHVADSEAGRASISVDELERALIAAQTTWTEDHPEVDRISKELTGMQGRLRSAEAKLSAERAERARMLKLSDLLEQQIQELQKKAAAYQERLDRTPQWAHELAMMERDYQVTREKYDSVISRKVEAELSRELELRASKDLFNVISPATVPSLPAEPDRAGGLIITLLVALGVGILAGVVVDMRDESIRSANDVRDRLPVPVLGVVPELGEGKSEKRVLLPATPRPGSGPEAMN
ncbi:MAG: Wzz/FepE/Etk N-terminal domain-containing protein [Myxococcaceae bacterium]